jgi:hypothetical protein
LYMVGFHSFVCIFGEGLLCARSCARHRVDGHGPWECTPRGDARELVDSRRACAGVHRRTLDCGEQEFGVFAQPRSCPAESTRRGCMSLLCPLLWHVTAVVPETHVLLDCSLPAPTPIALLHCTLHPSLWVGLLDVHFVGVHWVANNALWGSEMMVIKGIVLSVDIQVCARMGSKYHFGSF